MVGRLENGRRVKPFVGSNLTASATEPAEPPTLMHIKRRPGF